MKEIYGWRGRVLKINLSDKSSTTIEPGIELYEKFIGGRGLAGHYLRPFCHLPWDSPDMPLLFFTGPLCCTGSPSSGITSIMSVSPLSGAVTDSPVCGNFGAELKLAGWDGIIITGCSSNLCGITIKDQRVEFADARTLEGKGLSEIFSSLPQEGSSAAAGPAAENGVLFSCITFDRVFPAGGDGLGLVMHSKGLKFIHVEGTGETPVYDSGELNSAATDILRLVSASPALKGEVGFSEFGTGALFDLMHSRRVMPCCNFRKTRFEGAEKLNAWHYRERFGFKDAKCGSCSILCRKLAMDGRPIPGSDAMSHFSALIGNREIDLVMDAESFCCEQGMESASAASTIACYMEIKNLTPDQIDILKFLDDMARSSGDGGMLKLGSWRIASILGEPRASMSVKGIELQALDPRGASGAALACAVSTRGGCFMHAFPLSHEILRKPVATDRFSFSGKARIIKTSEDMYAAADSLSVCRYLFVAASLEEYAKVFHAATGINMDSHDLLRAGERICYNERIMARIRGFNSSDDDLPERFFSGEGSSGEGIMVSPIDRGEFLQARERYYRIRGLTPEGIPLEKKCMELGLKWIS